MKAETGKAARVKTGPVKALTNLLRGFFLEIGRFATLGRRTLAWTPRPPFDVREWTRQMVVIGVDSTPVILLTALFTGMVLALQTFATLKRVHAEGYVGTLVALSMVRELGCVLAALVLAG